MEWRHFEIRAEGEDGAPKLTGYAAVFDQLSMVLYGLFREKIARGAFALSLATDDIRALWNHDTNLPLGRLKAGTLNLEEDGHGLRVEINPPQTQAGRDAVESIRRGDVNQMSFGFEALDDDLERDDSGQMIRTLRKIKLYEVSAVVFPAYPQTSISARTIQDALGDISEILERIRRFDSGSDAERARARLAVMHRRLALVDRHSTRRGGG